MLRKRQSKNVIDERTNVPRAAKGERLLSSSKNLEYANLVLRSAYAESGQISRAQKKNAKALGLSKSLEDAQNIANKSQARLRRRMN